MTDAGVQQVLDIVGDKATSTDTLDDLLVVAEAQLTQYAKAQALLDATGPDGWSYEVYDESLRLAGGQGTRVSVQEWTYMELFPEKRDALRTQVLSALAEGRDSFEHIRSAIKSQLAARENKKPRLRFWKHAT